MLFATTSARKLVRPVAPAVKHSSRVAGKAAAASPIELFGACLMIGCFLVMAMFG